MNSFPPTIDSSFQKAVDYFNSLSRDEKNTVMDCISKTYLLAYGQSSDDLAQISEIFPKGTDLDLALGLIAISLSGQIYSKSGDKILSRISPEKGDTGFGLDLIALPFPLLVIN